MANAIRRDGDFMRMAIREARRGIGLTAPNPTVGAVIVRAGRVIGRGWHRRAGEAHAEIEALRSLARPELARGATLYVTLEPCSTTGRTPPCTRAIVAAGIARVVFGAVDPGKRNGGRARAALEPHGIAVRGGVLANECAALNEAWNHWIATGLPFVVAKAGLSLDGRIAPRPGSRWITSRAARADAMRLRAACDAILVGGGTVRADDPRLTVRGVPRAKQPLRVVWTRSGRLPDGAHIFEGPPPRVFQGRSLRGCLQDLARDGIQSVLIEGGGRTLGEAFDRGLVNRAIFYIAPTLIGGPTPAVGGRGCAVPDDGWLLENPEYRLLGGNLRVSGLVRRAKSVAGPNAM